MSTLQTIEDATGYTSSLASRYGAQVALGERQGADMLMGAGNLTYWAGTYPFQSPQDPAP